MSRPRLLRYSGSKADVMEKLLEYIPLTDASNVMFWDVFTGSGSVAEGVAQRYKNVQIVMNDLDQNLFALHHVIAQGTDHDFDTVLSKLDTMPTYEQVREVLQTEPTGYVDRAFRAMFLNRTCDSRAYGKRPMGGQKQNKNTVKDRYVYPNMVKTMLERRLLLKGRTSVTGEDFRRLIPRAALTPRSFIYCDPVYPEVGNDLYHNTPKWVLADHIQLRDLLLGLNRDWLLSYNDHTLITSLYQSECDIYPVRMPSQAQGGAKIELLIKPKETVTCHVEIPIGVSLNRIQLPL